MRLLIRVAIFFYVLLISVIGLSSLLFLTHIFELKTCENILAFFYADPHASVFAGVIVAAVLIVSLGFARVIYGRQEKERLISFDNPLGRVTISLSAIEDLVRRLGVDVPQIKELRPDITSKKKGLEADIKLILRTDVNIPEMTADLQDRIKRKIQDVIGSEERLNIRVHVVKISTDSVKPKKGSVRDDDFVDSDEPGVPFRGYRK